ncbi:MULTISPECIES: hypothetical protein [unclassified Acinetobacter]|uniref:hypothetical protein n=1 Tax=unclassified Acinetobacter TaxID=196816 RepID=UPI002577ED50|nr:MULTISPECIES: hypothetical protein [unclassified Acinetobacter]MDM1758029.1 hypothetical protein [Acinetobacter sp. 256-1]MDM1761162.1 hypothetical protein [Acinetobacter sp. 251-1]
MGTDIHGFFQKYENNQWVDITSQYDERRDYYLFSALANQREHQKLVANFIAEPRGLPEGIMLDEDYCYKTDSMALWLSKVDPKFAETEEFLKFWMGDHSRSWLSDDEMLEWYSSPQLNIVDGLITTQEYPSWDRTSTPFFDYKFFTSGSTILTEEEFQFGKKGDYIRIYWQQDIREYLAYFFDEVIRLKKLHGKIRFIFGFDN